MKQTKPQILFENNQLVVLDKPSGMVIHPFDFSNEPTVLDFLQENYLEVFNIENKFTLQDKREINLGGIVHKLDRDTSGILVVARTQHAFDELKKQFRNHEINKEYIALVNGILKDDQILIDAPLGRSKKDFKQSTQPENLRGEMREAITVLEVIKRNENTTLVKLIPQTGRTHQLRAHMASIGHPIVGDKSYGSKIESERIMLHAEKISFELNNQKNNFESQLPQDFK
ncbi:MAG: hypothetical protein JWN37_783 [Candidatus Nomurabacteria bacterium]|nr:hypothetical protein [Candidatus Nomurabacteria bacterium]